MVEFVGVGAGKPENEPKCEDCAYLTQAYKGLEKQIEQIKELIVGHWLARHKLNKALLSYGNHPITPGPKQMVKFHRDREAACTMALWAVADEEIREIKEKGGRNGDREEVPNTADPQTDSDTEE